MKYVALLSGGKDSCYNLLHCRKNGHELVAAASLGPGQGKDEIDSYMYQTVGQDAIELVAQALDVPLYRGLITGTAVNQESEYGGRNASEKGGVYGDETEDMYALLSTVKSKHPDIEGVSVGAILSNYQRVRVEHVCRRLSLTPLCYLWQRNQSELLSEMIQSGLEAILIKVAGAGLTAKHLGKTLAQMHPTLIKLNNLYDLHVCGEGGEYETLTLDCPLFKKRIMLVDTETVIHSDNDFATVAYLRIKKAELVSKEARSCLELTIPPLLEDKFVEVRDSVVASLNAIPPSFGIAKPTTNHSPIDFPLRSKSLGSWVAVTNVQRDTARNSGDIRIEDEVQECFHALQDTLRRYSLKLSHCANINLFLSSMDLFARVNAVYSTFFGSSPPSRACVAVDLPPHIHVRLDCVAYTEKNPHDRQALHVQGLSYWAPANIGPYSQAITVDERIFISGQIGLIPSSLSLPSPQSLPMETALSCQHVSRVKQVLRNQASGGWEGHTQAALYWLLHSDDIQHVREACKATEAAGTPTLFLVVASLPKGALIEKQVLLHTGRFLVEDEEGDIEVRACTPTIDQVNIKGEKGSMYIEYSHFDKEASPCAVVAFRGDIEQTILNGLKVRLGSLLHRVVSIRLFYRLSEELPELPAFLSEDSLPVTAIPCRSISTNHADNWDYAICIVGCR